MDTPIFNNFMNSEQSCFLRNINSRSPNPINFNINSASNSNNLSSLKFFASSIPKKNLAFQIFSNSKKIEDDILSNSLKKSNTNLTKFCMINKENDFSNSNSKPTKNTSNINSKAFVVDFLNKKRNFCIGSIKKNLMDKLQESSTINGIEEIEDEEIDLEKMIDFIVTSTKSYKKENKIKSIDKENISENANKAKELKRKGINENVAICKCKKIGCSKYSCNCLKQGLKCGKFCRCVGCVNK